MGLKDADSRPSGRALELAEEGGSPLWSEDTWGTDGHSKREERPYCVFLTIFTFHIHIPLVVL